MRYAARRIGIVTGLLLAIGGWTSTAVRVWADAAKPADYQPGPLVTAMLNSDFQGAEEIVFAVRVPGRDHWYVNFGYYSNEPDKPGYGNGGRLCRMNLKTGELKTLVDDPQGGVRDPQVHYDGQKILFS